MCCAVMLCGVVVWCGGAVVFVCGSVVLCAVVL